MGLWMGPLNVTRKHDKRFDTEWKSRGCSNKYVVLHRQSAIQMHEKHERLINSNMKRQCHDEYKERVEYEYDWSKPPSKCCPGRGFD
jgi:galactosylxylosylprotein 3-beta-galactosyltransferase